MSQRTSSMVAGIVFAGVFFLASVSLQSQVDLLSVEHPATRFLMRLHGGGLIDGFPAEHLPISRKRAHSILASALVDTTMPAEYLSLIRWYERELAADAVRGDRAHIIPTPSGRPGWSPETASDIPFTGIGYRDSASDINIVLDPILDASVRYDLNRSDVAVIPQGGVRLRGSVGGVAGFAVQATNGTILGSDSVVLEDPRFARSFKFGLLGANKDVDFGQGHLRFDWNVASVAIGRGPIRLGQGGERSLLLGHELPSPYDYLRATVSTDPIELTHIHAALLAQADGDSIGTAADIPAKFVSAHLATVRPSSRLSLSVGEGVIYSHRGIEIGYLNPFNFLKSQEHYLRDRDNALMYAAFRWVPVRRLSVEGEWMLDDLVFSEIGTGYWGNKTAWTVRFQETGMVVPWIDLSVGYTRLEPYMYSHFNNSNAYTHDGAMLASSGLQPNSHRYQMNIDAWPDRRVNGSIRAFLSEHGANPQVGGDVVRNVGGDATRTFDSLSSGTVEFLDGDLETTVGIRAQLDVELLRNVYARFRVFLDWTDVDRSAGTSSTSREQVWFGVHVGGL